MSIEIEAVRAKVNEVILDVLKDRISSSDILPKRHVVDDLCADSVEVLEIVLALMAEFNVEIDRARLADLKDIDGIHHYIYELANSDKTPE